MGIEQLNNYIEGVLEYLHQEVHIGNADRR
jgi:hypothetical protein